MGARRCAMPSVRLEGWVVADGTRLHVEACCGDLQVFEGQLDDTTAIWLRGIVDAARAAGVDGDLLDRFGD
ncbi:MAG: hypothetical protein H6723_15855 [Sandaracinus sp.]|nr:hypothetical protein [Sandaracinus sp.]